MRYIKCHLFSEKTAIELNSEWSNRKQTLEELGYDVVYIWEQDYKELAKCL